MLYIHLLGHLRLYEDEQPLTFSALPRTLPMWVYLLLNRSEPVPRDTLAYLLWPDVPERTARANLRRHLYELRRMLPPAPQDTPWLLSQAGTLQWNPAADYWLDVAEFERLSASPDHLAKAVALYTGDLLPDVYDDWIAFDRERLRNTYLAHLSQLVAQSRACGDVPQAIVYAQQILRHDPLREDTVRELISLRYRAGDRAGALQAYQSFERRLREELDVTPMPETRALYEAVIQNLPLPEVSTPSAAGQPVPLACPHNVPAQFNTFVGRDQELIAVGDLLTSGDSRVRLLTLTGLAGAGKTRLALEVATRMLPEQAGTFPDGIFFVDLSSSGEPNLVVPAIAATLGVEERGDRPLLGSLKDFLRARYLLLVLDNFEHVIEAGPQVVDLLAAAPNVRVLVTSRAALRVYGEHEYPVPPLPLPDLDPLPPAEDLLENPAVSLFVTRAGERQPAFALTESNASAVAEICVQLDGLPLAIELAASRIKIYSPAAILTRLTSRLAFLTDGPRDRPARHRTLRGAIDWSYDLLDEGEKTLFASLGVFASGCTLAAAEAVCGPFCEGDLSTLLASLVDKSLVQRLEDDDEPRFGMVASIREYALEQLARAGMLATIRQRHADYYADVAERTRSDWKGPQQAVRMKRLRVEEDNLRAALAWLLDEMAEETWVRVGAKLIWALTRFWETAGRFTEARAWFAQALAHRRRLSQETQVHLLNHAGWFAQLQGEYQAANKLYEDGLALARQTEDPVLISLSLHSLGTAAGRQGDYERSEKMLSEAIAIEREASGGTMTPHLAAMLNNLAIVAKHLGDYERAASLLQESLDFKRAQGDQLGVAISLANLGSLALLQEDHVGAEAFFRESLTLRQTLGDQKGMLILLSGLAELAMIRGEPTRSVCLYSVIETLHQEFGYSMSPANREEHDRHISTLREQLGEAEFAAAWARGTSMILDEAVAYALGAAFPDSQHPFPNS